MKTETKQAIEQFLLDYRNAENIDTIEWLDDAIELLKDIIS